MDRRTEGQIGGQMSFNVPRFHERRRTTNVNDAATGAFMKKQLNIQASSS